MLVKDKMTKNVITIEPQTTVPEALALMEEKRIRRLPVVEMGRLVGIVTLLDLVRASPSPATSLSIWELNYLLAKLSVKEVMAKKLHTVKTDDPIDEAAALLRENRIGGLPVVDNGTIVGIITETDIFTAFMEILGVGSSGLRLTLELPDRNGALAEADGLLRNFGVTVVSVVMMPRDAHKNLVQSIWRLQGCDDVDALLDFLREKSYRVVHFSESNVCTNI
ncbi:MAG: Inosine-5'-monophosphate dehydrogenase [Dehalococcoidia bacterium]|nr:Inosine-5'-monophosphate dehydrogenase [Bacillota bacterium]MBT9143041.1 Inosine-5'-monophosphate dehydrogenase [Bacillota bacterium]